MTKEDILTAEDVAKLLGISYRTLMRRLKKDTFPKPMMWGDKRRLWLRSDIEKYMGIFL